MNQWLKGSNSCLLLVTYLNGRIIVVNECVRHLYLPFLHHLLQDHPEGANKPMEQKKRQVRRAVVGTHQHLFLMGKGFAGQVTQARGTGQASPVP